MNKRLRIVFIGTPLFAVTSLKKLVNDQYNVVGVVTVGDKPAGRGRKPRASEVKKYAVSQDLPVLQPSNLKSEEFLDDLKALNPELIIVVAFRMLPEVVWSMPKYGTFNLHTSLLPEYRGSAPINWVIINGEKETGVTTFFINNRIDAGEMILQKAIKIRDDETYGELYEKMMYIGADILVQTVDLIALGDLETKKQPLRVSKLSPKLFIQDCDVDWQRPIDDVYNFIRGLNPHPTARTTIIDGKKTLDIKIYEVEKQYSQHCHYVGELIVSKKELKVAVDAGYIVLKRIQLTGKKQMDVSSFLNGHKFVTQKPYVCNVFINEGVENCRRCSRNKLSVR